MYFASRIFICIVHKLMGGESQTLKDVEQTIDVIPASEWFSNGQNR